MEKKTGGARPYMGILLSGVLAGMMISVGGTVYLSVDSKVVGASLFSIGVFFVVSMRLWRYTGKIGYLFRGGHGYAAKLLLTLVGNFAGAFGTALLLRQTRAAANLVGRAAELSAVKLQDAPASVFILAVFCGVLMYIGVNGFGVFELALGKYAAVFLAVAVFILSGFEHCVANMFYYSLAGVWGSGQAWLSMAVMVLGNSAGSVAVAEGYRAAQKLQDAA